MDAGTLFRPGAARAHFSDTAFSSIEHQQRRHLVHDSKHRQVQSVAPGRATHVTDPLVREEVAAVQAPAANGYRAPARARTGAGRDGYRLSELRCRRQALVPGGRRLSGDPGGLRALLATVAERAEEIDMERAHASLDAAAGGSRRHKHLRYARFRRFRSQ
jgi:hypothetical protein